MMANHPNIGQYDLGSLRLVLYGGSPAPLGIMQRAVKAIDTTSASKGRPRRWR
jgi:long-chain acyl-CoA synthetase